MKAFVAAGFRPVDTTNFALAQGTTERQAPAGADEFQFSEVAGRLSGNLLGSASLNTLIVKTLCIRLLFPHEYKGRNHLANRGNTDIQLPSVNTTALAPLHHLSRGHSAIQLHQAEAETSSTLEPMMCLSLPVKVNPCSHFSKRGLLPLRPAKPITQKLVPWSLMSSHSLFNIVHKTKIL